jgi:DNA-binding response OmpR family regulator
MTQARVLVVEDDPDVNRLIVKTLEREHMTAVPAYDGLEADAALQHSEFDLVILDLMIPRLDGWELLTRIRAASRIPVIILSARDEETDKIVGLGLGADDYMTKPFGVNELKARVKAHLRRQAYYAEMRHASPEPSDPVIRLGRVELDGRLYQCRVNGVAHDLTAKEFEIVKLLMTSPNRIFTKSQIYERVWGDEYVADDNTVMVHIRRIRKKIEPDPSEPQFIQTVWGIGYKWGERR